MSQPHSSQTPRDLALQFVTMNDHLRTGQRRERALDRLVELAVETIPGCDWASITEWLRPREPRSLAVSHPIAQVIDELQYQLSEGPALAAAAAESRVLHVLDMADDSRWAGFARRAHAETPVRSVLALHLTEQPARSSLNLYSRQANGFGDEARQAADLLSAHATVLLLHTVSTEKVVHLEQALATSRQIGMAIGILMYVYKVTSEQAFDMLRVSSQHLHRKLHEIALDVTQTGTLPDPPD